MMPNLVEVVARMLRPLAHRIDNLAQRVELRNVDDSSGGQRVQVRAAGGAIRAGVERPQSYGMTSVPPVGAEGVMLALGGRGDHALVVVVDDRRYRLHGLESGEVALYTDEGDKIHLKRGGAIEVTASAEIKLAAPRVILSGDSDAVAVASRVDGQLAEIRNLLLTWLPVPGDGGAALKAAAGLLWAIPPATVASAKIKADP